MLKLLENMHQHMLKKSFLKKLHKLNLVQNNLVKFNNKIAKYDVLWNNFITHKRALIRNILKNINCKNFYLKIVLNNLINSYYLSNNILKKKHVNHGYYLKLDINYVSSLHINDWSNDSDLILYIYYHINHYHLPKAVQKDIIHSLISNAVNY